MLRTSVPKEYLTVGVGEVGDDGGIFIIPQETLKNWPEAGVPASQYRYFHSNEFIRRIANQQRVWRQGWDEDSGKIFGSVRHYIWSCIQHHKEERNIVCNDID
jgi:hypothetical protein